MFDLFRSRAKAVRYMLGALLMLVAVSMVVTLIPGYGTSGGMNDQIVAEVGDEAVSLREVQLQLQQALRGQSLPPEMAAIYAPQMVDAMITERAMIYEAGRLGFEVTEADLARALRESLPQLFPNGQFVGRDVYAGFLAQQNLTIPEFENNFRKAMLVNKLRNMVVEGVVVTDKEVEDAFRRRNEKVKLEYVAISPEKYRSQVTVTPEEIKSHYDSNKTGFRVPEKRSYNVLVVDEAKVAAGITLPEEKLRSRYEADKDQYRTPERVQVRHILLKTTDVPAAEVTKIQAQAEDLLKQVKAGGDFAELAKKHSQDPGSAEKGGEIGWVVRGQTVPAFENTAFSLKPKEISNVVKTEYGFHIIQLMAKEDARLRPFEEVKDQIAEELKKQQVYDTMQRLADQVRDELAKRPLQADQIAQTLGVQIIKAENLPSTDPIPELGPNPELADAIQSAQKGGVTPVVQIANKLAVAVVTDVQPGRQAELAEVQDQIRQTLANQKAQQVVDQRAREAFETAKSSDLKAAARSLGVEVKTTQEFGMEGAADGIGAAQYVSQAFTEPVGAVFGPVAVGDQRFVARVAAKTPADMTKLPAERDNLRSELKGMKARQRNELFEDSLRTRLIQDGKIKINDDVVKRLVASYRG